MRVLIVGGGGREHALAWKLRSDDPTVELLAAPGNPGIARLAECVAIAAIDLDALERLARDRAVDLTIVGPEAPLAVGIVDRFRAAGLPVFGPTRAAAEIETSKAFAKRLMLEEGVPTARAEVHADPRAARDCAARFGAPVVIKASGLAAGKGVIVCDTLAEADAAIEEMLTGGRFGSAGAEVLVEEFMTGEELSVFAITDGQSFVMLPALQDHKRLLDDDRGPNTGGMGAYLPVTAGDAGTLEHDVASRVFAPVLRAMAARGRPFTGLLYAGLMLSSDGPRVVEFNCRFGDPETQALLPLLASEPSLLELMLAVATGAPLGGTPVDLDAALALLDDGAAHRGVRVTADGACVTTVLAAAGYPDAPRLGDEITLPSSAPDGVHVFHAGTALDGEGRLVTAGGRVLTVSAVAPTVQAARERSLEHALEIRFAGRQLRRDIGWRQIAREHEASARASRD